MGNAALIHKVKELESVAEARAYLTQTRNERAESFRELLRMINRDHLKTLNQVNQEIKRRNLN